MKGVTLELPDYVWVALKIKAAVNGGAISGHGGGVKSGQLLSRRLKQKAPFAKGAFCFSALV
jgi:hypothetical protein